MKQTYAGFDPFEAFRNGFKPTATTQDDREQETRGLPSLLRAAAAAQLLGISPRKLWELTNSGQIKHIRIGRRVLYDESDLRQFIQDHRCGVDART